MATAGGSSKVKDHSTAAKELKTALAKRGAAPTAERALRELIGAEGDVEYTMRDPGSTIAIALCAIVNEW